MDKRVDSSLKVLLGRGARATASHSVRGMFGDSLLDVLPDAILETDSKGLIVAANASATSLSGWTREELLGQPIAPLMDGADVSWLENMILAYLPQGKGHSPVRSRRVFVKRKNGLPFAAELTVLEMDLGEGFGFAAILHDLTQIHEAEKALRESQERHALALAGTNEGIWDWDLTSNKVYYSERVQSLFGLEKEMGSPEDWLPFLHEEDRPRYLAAMKAHLKGETPFFNIDYRLKGPEERWVRHRGLGLRNDAGRVYRMAGSAGDITDAKKAEAKLRETLVQTEAANKAKSDFLAAMSHELRTPLNAIIGFSEMIHAQLLGPAGVPKYVEYAGDILASAGHLLDIINDILEMARMEAGHTEFHPTPLDISATIEGSLRLLHQRISHSGLILATKIAPRLPRILGDDRRLKQVLINLVGNAIKFTPKGGQIVVEAKPVLNGQLMVRVVDSGIGIAERDIPRALAPFTQVDSVLARRYQGSGLGLPLAKALVELHGGNLELSSILGKGTTVTLYFPTLSQPD